jgi:hypothetical protein
MLMKTTGMFRTSAVLIFVLLFIAQSAFAYVPVRISIKFIVDANGNRPTAGHLNTDAEINTEFNEGNRILAINFSEFRLELIEFYDLTGVSQYYTANATTNNCVNVGNLRSDATSNPSTYGWRNDAINIYINGGTSSACSNFPPNNDIILMNQW